MPSEIKKMMNKGVPIGSRPIYDRRSGFIKYYKFNGLRDENVERIATYLICITLEERRDILERMLLTCRVCQFHKVIEEYQKLARELMDKNKYRIESGHPIVCDHVGVIH